MSWYQQQFGAEQGQTADERIDGRIALQWRPSDQLLLTVDDNYSRQYVKTVTYAFGAWFDFTTFGPNCDQARALDPTLIGSHVLVRTRQENSDTLKQTRFVVSWNDENVKLDLGASYLDDTFELRSFNTFANNLWQAWAGYGPPSGRSSGVVLPASLQQGTISTANFIPGFSGAQALMPKLLVYSPPALYSYLEGLGNPQTHHIDGFNYGCCDYTGSLDLALDPGSIQKIQEKTWAAFFHGHFDAKVAQMPLHFDAGIRREHTGIVSGGFGRLPVLLTKNPADPTLLSTTYSNPQPISTSSDYAYLLPSLDMKLELTPRIHFRLDASRTLTRPAINYLTLVLNVGALPRVGALNANGGNPTLKPYLSDNLDFALEWYYQPNSYVAVDYFVKNVSNFIVQGTSRQTINNVIDPTTGQPAVYTVAQRVNGPDAMVDGVELAWQHVFGNSGFGFNANVTLVDTNKPYDRKDITQSGFAVTGLANSANFVGFYDKHGFELRVAANWRDQYLRQFGQTQNLSAFGAEPTFVNTSLQIDVSTSYQLSEQVNLFFEALNLTNDTLSTHGRFDNQLLDVYAYGRRYSAGVRLRL